MSRVLSLRTSVLSPLSLCLALSVACADDGGGEATEGEVGADTDSSSGSGSEESTGSESTESESSTESSTESDSTETETETDTGSAEPWLEACPEVDGSTVVGSLADPAIDEASGLVRSSVHDLLWAHNDSGDSARVFAVGLEGQALATIELVGAPAVDWEDMALGPKVEAPETGDWLYLGDIGDNAEARPSIAVLRMAEPASIRDQGVGDWELLALTYPDGPHNAETLLVDPLSGDLFIVTKGEQTKLYGLPAPLASGELVALADPNFPSAIATAGDISANGDAIVVRGYAQAFLWLRPMDASVEQAMLGEPCSIPLAAEQQGECVALVGLGLGVGGERGYYTVSEGAGSPLSWYAFGG